MLLATVYTSGSHSVLHGSHGICDQLPGDPWIYFCTGHFKEYMFLNERNNVLWNERGISSVGDMLVSYDCLLVCCWRDSPHWARASSFTRFLDHTQRRATVGRTPLDEWSARRRDLYLTTDNTYNRQNSMPPVGFEPTISAGERL